ncbi:MAG: hypothetical protein KF878_00220 [Planctomycetes bacterium]|nr:hypothetical protein [Planctomycetota bacterium]
MSWGDGAVEPWAESTLREVSRQRDEAEARLQRAEEDVRLLREALSAHGGYLRERDEARAELERLRCQDPGHPVVRDPGAERWSDLEGALIDAIGWLAAIARGAEEGRRLNAEGVRQRCDALLRLADEIQDARHERRLCPGPGKCAACDVEAEEGAAGA